MVRRSGEIKPVQSSSQPEGFPPHKPGPRHRFWMERFPYPVFWNKNQHIAEKYRFYLAAR